MIVLDASAALDLFLNLQPRAAVVSERIKAEEPEIFVPHLFDAEVAQVLRRYVLRERISPAYAHDVLQDLGDMPLTRVPHGPLLNRALDLRDNTTVYDALYLVLAESLGAVLLTSDAALAKIPGHNAIVELTSS